MRPCRVGPVTVTGFPGFCSGSCARATTGLQVGKWQRWGKPSRVSAFTLLMRTRTNARPRASHILPLL